MHSDLCIPAPLREIWFSSFRALTSSAFIILAKMARCHGLVVQRRRRRIRDSRKKRKRSKRRTEQDRRQCPPPLPRARAYRATAVGWASPTVFLRSRKILLFLTVPLWCTTPSPRRAFGALWDTCGNAENLPGPALSPLVPGKATNALASTEGRPERTCGICG